MSVRGLYRVVVRNEYIVVADDEEQARELYEEFGVGDIDDSYIEDVYFVEDCED